MKCYDFEAQISAYIDGELKPTQRKDFTLHRQDCPECAGKLDDIVQMLQTLHELPVVQTSEDFMNRLQKKIDDHNSGKTSIWQRIIQFRPFGLDPIPAFGFAAAIVLMTISTFMIFDLDRPPQVDFDRLTARQAMLNEASDPLASPPLTAGATLDTTALDSVAPGTRPYDAPIHLVNQPSSP